MASIRSSASASALYLSASETPAMKCMLTAWSTIFQESSTIMRITLTDCFSATDGVDSRFGSSGWIRIFSLAGIGSSCRAARPG